MPIFNPDMVAVLQSVATDYPPATEVSRFCPADCDEVLYTSDITANLHTMLIGGFTAAGISIDVLITIEKVMMVMLPIFEGEHIINVL